MVEKKKKKRKKISKKKKPSFSPLNLGHKKKVKPRWRKPRGTANKKRRRFDFTGASPNVGYKNPESARGLRSDGLKEVLVRSLKDIDALKDKKGIAIMIAGSVGKKKRIEMLDQAKQLGIKVLNFREIPPAKQVGTPPKKEV